MTTLRWSRDQALSAPIAAEAGIPFRADQRQPEPILLPPYSSISVLTCLEVKSGHHPFLGLIDFYFQRLDSLCTSKTQKPHLQNNSCQIVKIILIIKLYNFSKTIYIHFTQMTLSSDLYSRIVMIKKFVFMSPKWMITK